MCALIGSQVDMDKWWKLYMKQQAFRHPFRDWKEKYKYYYGCWWLYANWNCDTVTFFEGVGPVGYLL